MNANDPHNQSELTQHLPTELEVRADIANLRQALLEGPKAPNIWAYYSNKNQKLLTLIGDVTFIQAVFLEGDPLVRSYEVISPEANGDDYTYGRNILVEQVNGRKIWLMCGRSENLVNKPTGLVLKKIDEIKKIAEHADAIFEIVTETNFLKRMIEFWNWISLSGAMTRASDQTIQLEHSLLIDSIAKAECVSIDKLLKLEGIDPALMLAAVANALSNGYLHADLKNKPINLDTILSAAPVKYSSTAPIGNLSSVSKSDTSPLILPHNIRTSKVPDGWKSLTNWPEPVKEAISDHSSYARNKLAVEMYMYQRKATEILTETGIRVDWARKLFHKCIKFNRDGRIEGFRSLVKYIE